MYRWDTEGGLFCFFFKFDHFLGSLAVVVMNIIMYKQDQTLSSS